MNRIRVVNLSGTPYQMGYAHGQRFHDEIHHFTEERIRLCSSPEWTGRQLSRVTPSSPSPKPASPNTKPTRPTSWVNCKASPTPPAYPSPSWSSTMASPTSSTPSTTSGDITEPARRANAGRRQLHRIHGARIPQRCRSSLFRPNLGYARLSHALRHLDPRTTRCRAPAS